MEEKKYCVYMHKNKINGKCYIGITNQKPEDRWGNQGCNYANQNFYHYIIEYGWDNFEHVILETNISDHEIDKKEKYYINKYNSFNDGYNMTLGGRQNNNEYWKDIGYTKKKKEIFSSDLYKEHCRVAALKRLQNSEAVQNHLNAMNLKCGVKVANIENKIVFNSYSEAARWCGLKDSEPIRLCANKKRERAGTDPITHKKLHWIKYNELSQEEKLLYTFYNIIELKSITKPKKEKKEKIKIINIETGKIFNTLSEAVEWADGIHYTECISRACRGIVKTSGKHPETGVPLHWQFYTEEGDD